jgi:hypothetical protein
MKSGLQQIKTLVLILGVSIGGFKGCNSLFNDKTQTTPSHYTISKSKGIQGHIDYTIYKDKGCDVKVYPNFSHRTFSSKLYQDFDGDKKVDRIRVNNGEIKMNSLQKILVREYDYNQNRSEFDRADSLLSQLAQKYNR